MTKRFIFILILSVSFSSLFAQEIKVLTLGTFHFNFPNADVQKIDDNDQIDVLKAEHQLEIETIINKIAHFNPTIIAIEADPQKQTKIDSVYMAYLNGKHELNRNEYDLQELNNYLK